MEETESRSKKLDPEGDVKLFYVFLKTGLLNVMTEIMKVAGLCIHLIWLIQSVNVMFKKNDTPQRFSIFLFEVYTMPNVYAMDLRPDISLNSLEAISNINGD